MRAAGVRQSEHFRGTIICCVFERRNSGAVGVREEREKGGAVFGVPAVGDGYPSEARRLKGVTDPSPIPAAQPV